MNALTRRIIVGTAVASMALSLTACGQNGSSASSASGNQTVGLLLPERASSTRYEAFDKPLIEASIAGLCTKCQVDYANAEGNEQTQKQQFDDMLSKGTKVIILDPVNGKGTASWVQEANAKGTKVISYDRLASGNVTAYVAYDSERAGELQGQALLDALGSKASNANIVMINGAEADPNAAQFKAGAHKMLDGKVKKIAYEQSGEWKPDLAAQKMNEAIQRLGKDGFQAVYAANDGMAASIIGALQSAGIKVPVGGQDASLDAIRRVVAGEQAYTIYKPFRPETDAVANLAVYLLKGLDVTSVATTVTVSDGNRIPSTLLTPLIVTKQNVEDSVVAGGLYKATDICVDKYADACSSAGIK
ncbi:sugar ABC transporter substrate-binding protein [Kitasatospora sp. NPDC001175]|uniref:sugar ABC transporter substrate-binding protein n=1 Tax=Kitasatospora sp. NPDC001175 TaxID=3157103 RepID=UPI003CFD3D47